MVFAVATLDTVVLYDTQQTLPIAMIGRIHYATLTDLTWSSDGKLLVISSSDGYCSLVEFEERELGCHLTATDLQQLNQSSVNKTLDGSSQQAHLSIVTPAQNQPQTHPSSQYEATSEVRPVMMTSPQTLSNVTQIMTSENHKSMTSQFPEVNATTPTHSNSTAVMDLSGKSPDMKLGVSPNSDQLMATTTNMTPQGSNHLKPRRLPLSALKTVH